MWTSAVVLSMFSVALASEFELFNSGWIPVSSDIVLNQIRRDITQAPRYTTTDDVQIVNTDLLSIVSEYEKHEEDGHKQDIIDEDTDQFNYRVSGATSIDGKIKHVPRFRHNFELNMLQQSENQNAKTKTNLRIPKKMEEKELVLDCEILPNNSKAEPKNILQDANNQLQERTDGQIHTYEVTENIIIENMKQDDFALKKRGYVYNPPKKLNFTNSLNKYLSKYSIKNIDNLQNYALSRRPKTYTPLKQNYLPRPLQFQVPMRYNSLNHLPVDPLLAVFLSNYGYYLQGQYGIQNNYNNLYGYLASNNIHNNRPFGFYKLFSDTDSSQ